LLEIAEPLLAARRLELERLRVIAAARKPAPIEPEIPRDPPSPETLASMDAWRAAHPPEPPKPMRSEPVGKLDEKAKELIRAGLGKRP
jgi:hypothetical protein